ncbi:MAG: hypothetical protein HY899_15240 [Deltaproteobacteria bacterium]|nr:hypothetical protein [Deltaproteobacteria bacterium]
MKKFAVTFLAVVAMLAAVLPADAQIVTSSPGKKAVYARGSVPFVGMLADYDVTIAKGAKKRVLEVDAMLGVLGCSNERVNVAVIVNTTGVAYSMYIPALPTDFRTGTGVWYLDLDDAETNSPGNFVNQPLNITVRVNALTSNCTLVQGLVRARLVKK